MSDRRPDFDFAPGVDDTSPPPLDPDLDALLGAERARPEPDAAHRAAFVDAILARVATHGGGGGDGGETADGAASGGTRGALVGAGAHVARAGAGAGGVLTGAGARLAAMFVVGALAGAATTAAVLRGAEPAPTASAPPPAARSDDGLAEPGVAVDDAPARRGAEPAAPGSASPPAADPPGAAGSAAPATARAPATHAPAAATPRTGVASDEAESRERAWIERARAARARGDLAAVLDAADAHRRDFPRGELAEERELLAIQALVRLGRRTEAVERAARFRKAWPESVHLAAVDGALR